MSRSAPPYAGIRMFNSEQEGFGHTYHRFMVNRLLWRLVDTYALRSVCEVPCGGYDSENEVIGADCLPFAVKGCKVTYIDETWEILRQARRTWNENGLPRKAGFLAAPLTSIPVEDDTYDLVWNSTAMPVLQHPESCLPEIRRISKRFVLLICPNSANYAYPLYVLGNVLARRAGKYASSKWLRRGYVREALVDVGMNVIEEGPVDVPPWPGFTVFTGLLRRFHRPTLPESRSWHEELSIVSKQVSKYSFIEDSRLPAFIKYKFAHLFYVLAEKSAANKQVPTK